MHWLVLGSAVSVYIRCLCLAQCLACGRHSIQTEWIKKQMGKYFPDWYPGGGKSKKGRKATEMLLSVSPPDIDFGGVEEESSYHVLERACLLRVSTELCPPCRLGSIWTVPSQTIFPDYLVWRSLSPPLLSPSLSSPCLIILKAISDLKWFYLSICLFIVCISSF